jgi:HD-like signal output (HDOD) protein
MSDQNRGREFLHQISEKKLELPISPELVQKLFSLAREDSLASMEDISRIISRDQSLTARILKRVNSAYYGLQAQISTVSRAVSILGLSQIRDIILSIGLKSVSRQIDIRLIDLTQYWHHQSSTAILGRELARKTGFSEQDDLFTIGILHDLGKLTTAIYDRTAWVEINSLAREKGLSLHLAEQEYWGIDHALIGGMILQQWNLPEWITEPVNWHHSPETASEEHRTASRLLYTANSLTHYVQDEESQEIDFQLEKLDMQKKQAEEIAAGVIRDPAVSHLQQLFLT